MTNSILPILIFGENRNGTTWLGNTLITEFSVTMPYHKIHFGMLETCLFSINRKWEKFKTKSDYLDFLEYFIDSDLFITCKGEPERYRSLHFENYYEFFIDLIHECALKEGSNAWAIKVEPRHLSNKEEWQLFLITLRKKYESVKCISIKRNFDAYFNSSKKLFRISKTRNKIHENSIVNSIIITTRYKHFYSQLKKATKDLDYLALEYLDFKNEHKNALDQIGSFLGIRKKKRDLHFIQNSSSKTTIEKSNFIENAIIILILKIPFLASFLNSILEIVMKKFNIEIDAIKFRIKAYEQNPTSLEDVLPEGFNEHFSNT